MNRHDWMNILTKGFRPPKINKLQKSLKPITTSKDEIVPVQNDVSEKGSAKIKSREILLKIQQEEISRFRNSQNINVSGSDIPPPIRSFSQLSEDWNMNARVYENLLLEKYVEPTPIQMQAWSLLLKRREILACAPTGSGKTAAFLLPIIHHLKNPRKTGFRALILAPTRELATQIVRECNRLAEEVGLKASVIYKKKTNTHKSFFKKIDILVTTPNKLIYLMQEDENLKQILASVEWLIVDESDKLFEDGKRGFREQLASIFQACSGPNVLRAMFSATLSYDVEQWCKLNLNDVVTVFIGARNTCPDVDQSLNFCACNAGKLMEIHEILRKGYEIPCLIFVQTKERAKKLCEEILLTNRPVQCIHSDLSQARREEIVRDFRQKKVWILICTELMSRGIDFKGVNLVINYDFPPSVVSYVHRVGRTGRAGKKGRAVTFWTMEDKPLLRNSGGRNGCSVPHWLSSLRILPPSRFSQRNVALVMKNSGSEVPEWILKTKSSSLSDRKRYAKHLPDREDTAPGDAQAVKKKKAKENVKRKKNSSEQDSAPPKKKKLEKQETESVSERKESKSSLKNNKFKKKSKIKNNKSEN